MKNYINILILLFITVSTCAQQGAENETVEQTLEPIVEHFRSYPSWYNKSDTVTTSSLFQNDDFNLSLSSNPIQFDLNHMVVENPFYTDNFDDYDDNLINYPLSHSVVYNNIIITLFDGGFICLNLDDFERDTILEKKLNTKKFKYHWLLDNELIALSGNRLFTWNEEWEKSSVSIPMELQPKLFENTEFLVFSDCFGEWGGTVYFYDRNSDKVHFTEATCANTVYEEKGKYYIQSQLGHMAGSTELKEIEDPRKLPIAKRKEINKIRNGQGYADSLNEHKILFEGFGLQLFSIFEYEGRRIGIAHINELTFLVEVNDSELEIVNPLFGNDLYTHEPITTNYGDIIFINLDFWGIARDREVSVILIQSHKITKIDWNENHSR